MRDLLLNKTAYLSASFVLLLAALPLISLGTTGGDAGAGGGGALLWAGIACMGLGTLLLPVQRLLTGTDRSAEDEEES